MALQSTDIDALLEKASNFVRSIRAEAINVKQSTNRADSQLSQFATDNQALIEAVGDLEGSSNPVDALQVAKLQKITSEVAILSAQIAAVKTAIDSQL